MGDITLENFSTSSFELIRNTFQHSEYATVEPDEAYSYGVTITKKVGSEGSKPILVKWDVGGGISVSSDMVPPLPDYAPAMELNNFCFV